MAHASTRKNCGVTVTRTIIDFIRTRGWQAATIVVPTLTSLRAKPVSYTEWLIRRESRPRASSMSRSAAKRCQPAGIGVYKIGEKIRPVWWGGVSRNRYSRVSAASASRFLRSYKDWNCVVFEQSYWKYFNFFSFFL